MNFDLSLISSKFLHCVLSMCFSVLMKHTKYVCPLCWLIAFVKAVTYISFYVIPSYSKFCTSLFWYTTMGCKFLSLMNVMLWTDIHRLCFKICSMVGQNLCSGNVISPTWWHHCKVAPQLQTLMIFRTRLTKSIYRRKMVTHIQTVISHK